MRKMVGVFGSPRPDGNSDILLNHAIKGAETHSDVVVEKVVIRDLHIAPCNSCNGCFEKGVCVIDDDMQIIYSRFVDADVIIVASPIYFMGVSAQLKALIDRCQAFWARKYILHLPIRKDASVARGFFIATAARSNGEELFTGAVKTMKSFFHVLDTKYMGDILCAGLEEKGVVCKKQEILQQAFDAGKQLLHRISE